MELRERIASGERVKVQGKYSGMRFSMQLVEAALGVRFLCAFSEQGDRIPNQNVMWGTLSADAWMNGVRIATGGVAR